ncbi:MAG: S8 family peptidase [Chloroflexota bacterium]
MFRVIWQYGIDVLGPLNSEALNITPMESHAGVSPFADIVTIGAAEPVFSRSPITLRSELLAMPAAYQADPANDLAGYHHVFVPTREAAETLRNRLMGDANVVYAEIQGELQPPFIIDESRRTLAAKPRLESLTLYPVATQNFIQHQVYLNSAPDGIDAHYAWPKLGGKGMGIKIIDIEFGWNFDHEDLRLRQTGVIHGDNTNHDHGTAVLGIFSGDENGFGIQGISSDAMVSAASAVYDFNHRRWNAANAIKTAADRLTAGDIILLEMHAPGPNASNSGQNQGGYIAVEYWQDDFSAIQYAVQRGIHVVEAAGNGGEDLDDPIYGNLFSRSLRDSGAILVGGGGSALRDDARSRMGWSNYGSRLDVQGWGEDIVTTGGRSAPSYYDLVDHPDGSRCYTQSFGGTSGASPIVVGAIAIIGGMLKAAKRPPLSPRDMRNLLVQTGTPQTGSATSPVSQHIGPLPDIRKAIEVLGLS